MSGNDTPVRDRDAVFAGRIDILYALGRHYLSLPFAALCIPATMFAGNAPGWLPFMPLVLQITVVIAAEQLTTAYKKRNGVTARRSIGRGAMRSCRPSPARRGAWACCSGSCPIPSGAGLPGLAFLGMTATEFIARSAYRPAYFAHAMFSLGPLVAVLLWTGGSTRSMTAVLVALFGGVLFTTATAWHGCWTEHFLKLENLGLIEAAVSEKEEVEIARDARRRAAGEVVVPRQHQP